MLVGRFGLPKKKEKEDALMPWRQDQGHLGRKLWSPRCPAWSLEGAGPWGHMETSPWSHRLHVGKHEDIGESEGPFKMGDGGKTMLPDSKGSSVHANNLEILISNLETRLIWHF